MRKKVALRRAGNALQAALKREAQAVLPLYQSTFRAGWYGVIVRLSMGVSADVIVIYDQYGRPMRKKERHVLHVGWLEETGKTVPASLVPDDWRRYRVK